MKPLIPLLAVLALASCRSVPAVFVTPETDAAIEAVAEDVDAISGAAVALDDAVEGIQAGDVLTVEQVAVIKENTKIIVKEAKAAKKDIATVAEEHKEDNKAASGIVVDLVKETEKNAGLWRWVFILGAIVAAGVAVIVLKVLGKF